MQRPQPDPQRLPPRAALRGSGDGAAALAPTQWIGEPSSWQEATAAAAVVANESMLKQMAYEDGWTASSRDFNTPFASDEDARKASNPDFETPFASDEDALTASNQDYKAPLTSDEEACKASSPDITAPFVSVEDAVSRLRSLADYDEDDVGDAHASRAKSSAQEGGDGMEDKTLNLISAIEKQVLHFNTFARGRTDGTLRGEEVYMLERALFQDERLKWEHARAVVVQQEKQRQEEAARTRLALGQAQAQASAQAQLQLEAQAQAHANPWRFGSEHARAVVVQQEKQQQEEAASTLMLLGQAQAQAQTQIRAHVQVEAQAQAQAQAQVQTEAARVWQTLQAVANTGYCGDLGFPCMQEIVAALASGVGPVPDTRGTIGWLKSKEKQLLQQYEQQQQQLQRQQQQQLRMGVRPLAAQGSSSRQVAVPQDQAGGQTPTSGTAGARTTQQWWQNAAPKEK